MIEKKFNGTPKQAEKAGEPKLNATKMRKKRPTAFTEEDSIRFRLFKDCEMPKGFRERFITSAYRRAYSTPWQCVKSLFYINNESFNVWSHIFTTVFFVMRHSTLLALTQTPHLFDPFNLSLFASGIGTLTVYTTSSMAHLFNSISERGYKICFFFDYAAISLYTFTSAQAMFFYIRPTNTNWIIFEIPSVYLCLAATLSFLATYSTCKTGNKVFKYSNLLRTISCLVAWLNSTSPFIVGVTLCSCHASSSTSCMAFAACNSASVSYYFRHAFCTVVAGLMYSTKLPERLLPGRFDLVGNSHPFMHVFVALSTEFGFKIVEFDIKHKRTWIGKREGAWADITADISFINTVGAAVVVMLINAGIALWFSRSLKSKESVHEK